MKKKVTKQKLYEALILYSYMYAESPEIVDEAKHLEEAGYDVFNMTFDELRMARAVLGLDLNIPDKQPFDKLGFDYFAQITGFVFNISREELLDMYFSVLNDYPDMVDFTNTEQAGFMYDVFLDQITNDRYVCKRLGSYLFRHAEKCDWYPRFLSIAYGLGMFDNDIYLSEMLEMKKKHPLKEM